MWWRPLHACLPVGPGLRHRRGNAVATGDDPCGGWAGPWEGKQTDLSASVQLDGLVQPTRPWCFLSLHPVAEFIEPRFSFIRSDTAVAFVFDVLLDKEVAGARFAGEQRIVVGDGGADEWVISRMDRKDRARKMSGQRLVALQVSERAGVRGVAFDAIVESVVVGSAGVDRVAIIE